MNKETSSGIEAKEPNNASVPDSELKPNGQHKDYWVLPKEERDKGFIRPVRQTYIHEKCGTATSMSLGIAETYARDPSFYGSTFCCGCGNHYPVVEFNWDGTTEKVGS